MAQIASGIAAQRSDVEPVDAASVRPKLGRDAQAPAADPIGRYAIQFMWSDGHSTGLYTFDHLRGLADGTAEERPKRGE